jgi:hypothetical protein
MNSPAARWVFRLYREPTGKQADLLLFRWARLWPQAAGKCPGPPIEVRGIWRTTGADFALTVDTERGVIPAVRGRVRRTIGHGGKRNLPSAAQQQFGTKGNRCSARRFFPRQKGCADTCAHGAARVHAAVPHFHHQEFAAKEPVATEQMKDGAS